MTVTPTTLQLLSRNSGDELRPSEAHLLWGFKHKSDQIVERSLSSACATILDERLSELEAKTITIQGNGRNNMQCMSCDFLSQTC